MKTPHHDGEGRGIASIQTFTRAPTQMVFKHLAHHLAIVGVATLLILSSWNTRPTSYLHSWNQITTLTHISSIVHDPSTWNKPFDYVGRMPAGQRQITIDETRQAFRVFEEFPLYHLVSAGISRLGLSPENASRVVSVAAWVAAAYGVLALMQIAAPQIAPRFALLLFLSSFPCLYYGVAIMSDMLMVALWIWSLIFFERSRRSDFSTGKGAALSLLALSGLAKSYGILGAGLWIHAALSRSSTTTQRRPLVLLPLCALAIAPTLLWHLYGVVDGGQQEFHSHSLGEKLRVIFSVDLLNALQKGYFRYLSYLPGIAVIGAVLWLKGRKVPLELPSLLKHAALLALVFILLCADKIPNHDYYLLLPFVPLVTIAGVTFGALSRAGKERGTLAIFSAVVLVAMFLPSVANLRRALTENPDVVQCATVVASVVPPEEITASTSDFSRFNSIAYYAQRFAVRVDPPAPPLESLRAAGVRFFMVNLPPEEFASFVHGSHLAAENLVLRNDLRDFKDKPRVCAVFRL